MLGWRDVPVGQVFAAATGLPVRVDNHARALARAEQRFGDWRARTSVLHLFVGNTIDAAFATGGKIHHGPQSAAGAVAHLPLEGRPEPCLCGRRGCLQAVVSRAEVSARSRLCADPGRSIVVGSFEADILPVAAGTVILDALYANPLRRSPRGVMAAARQPGLVPVIGGAQYVPRCP
jgi:predicted NBD/HSP70 family sugar kinase